MFNVVHSLQNAFYLFKLYRTFLNKKNTFLDLYGKLKYLIIFNEAVMKITFHFITLKRVNKYGTFCNSKNILKGF